MNLDYLFAHLGENKVTQEILSNRFEQSTSYRYSKENDMFYEDLTKKRNKSLPSYSSSSGCNLAEMGKSIYNVSDPFMYLMYYIKTPSISLMSKDVVQQTLKDYRKSICEDDQSFLIKKLTKTNKQKLLNLLSSEQPLKEIDEIILNYFSHILKVNIVVVIKSALMKAVLCNEDNFDTVVIRDPSGRGMFKLIEHGEHNDYVLSWKDAKTYLIEKKLIDRRFIESLTVSELRTVASQFEIPISRKNDEGKVCKLLKDDLKIEILKKI